MKLMYYTKCVHTILDSQFRVIPVVFSENFIIRTININESTYVKGLKKMSVFL